MNVNMNERNWIMLTFEIGPHYYKSVFNLDVRNGCYTIICPFIVFQYIQARIFR